MGDDETEISLTKKEHQYLIDHGIHSTETPSFENLAEELRDVFNPSETDLPLRDIDFEEDSEQIRKELEEEMEKVEEQIEENRKLKRIRPGTLDQRITT